MIHITTHPIVLESLQKAFPQPANAATKALNKYLAVLSNMLFEALQRGQSVEERKLNLFSISTAELALRGPQIGKKKIRLHKWLCDNDLALVNTATVGSNLSGKVSQVRLTSFVSMTDTLLNGLDEMTEDLSRHEIDTFLDGTPESNAELFRLVHPEYSDTFSDAEVDSMYDSVQIDINSLKNYIEWLCLRAKLYSIAKKNDLLRQARLVLGVALARNGCLLQRKKPSHFGRTYYHGISVQNVNKQLRAAMLGHCWEYDMRSSVVSWKMGFASEYLLELEPSADFRRIFSTSIEYLENKKSFMVTVQRDVFDISSNATSDLQLILLKQAMTALSFGARMSARGWHDHDGTWNNPALVDILKNGEERKRFLDHILVRSFVSEQNMLDGYLYSQIKVHAPALLKKIELQTAGGRPSKPKVLAYMYQHAESSVMDVVRDSLREHGYTILARIHDAIIVSKKLSLDDRDEIQHRMHDITKNPYWYLTPKEIKGFEASLIDEKREIELHKDRIAADERRAARLYGIPPQ